MIFDLHIHTNYSHGLFSPKEVVDLSIKKNLDGIAITDHDTTDGIEEAIEYNKSLNKSFHIIPGIEFSSIYEDEEVHVLGYFIDYKSKEIMDLSNKFKRNRLDRSLKIIDKLNNIGLNINMKEIRSLTNKEIISRSHIAMVLVQKGYVKSIDEAFNLYLHRGRVGYVEKASPCLEATINIIHDLGGIAVLAHPGLLKNKAIIKYCINCNIDGIEAIHSKHSSEDVKLLLRIAKENNLVITGGSDCHGRLIDGEYLLGKYYINLNHIPIMKGRI